MKYMPWFQKFALVVVGVTYRLAYKIEVEGLENIPKEGCLICANHPSVHDPLFVAVTMGLKHEISAMGKKELYEKKWLEPILIAIGTFPVDRGNADMKAIKQCLSDVKNSKKLILFPEGTRTKNSGKKAKAGVGLIAKKTGCPIVPVYIDNAPKLFGKVKITYGECIMPPPKEQKVSSEEFAQSILDHIFKMGE